MLKVGEEARCTCTS